MVDYIAGIKRPFTQIKKLVIAVLLMIFPIINFFSFGYVFLCGRYSMSQAYNLPEWKGNFAKCFKQGFFGLIILIIYYLPAVLFTTYIFYKVFTTLIAAESVFELAQLVGVGQMFLLAILLFLICAYFAPAAVLNYVSNEKLSSAFDFKLLSKRTINKYYFKAWLISSAYSFALFGAYFIMSYYLIFPIISLGIIGDVIGSTILVLLQGIVIVSTSITKYTLLGESFAEVYYTKKREEEIKKAKIIPTIRETREF